MAWMEEFSVPKPDEDVCIIEAGPAARKRHGEAYGSQIVMLTAEQLRALNSGRQLAIDIMSGEYVLFLNGPEAK